MAINKVIYGNETLIDLTNDTVSSSNLLAGATAHGANGEPITGNVITHNVVDNLTSTSTEDALSANQGRVLNEKNEVLSDTVNQNWQGKGYNLIPFPYLSIFPRDVAGVHYELNTDGSISVRGTVTSQSGINLASFNLKAGTYALSGAKAVTGRPRIRLAVNGTYNAGSNFDGIITPFTITEESEISIQLQFINIDAAVDTVFKPMLVEVDSNGNYPTEYQRYGMGNVELQNSIEGISGGDEWLASKAYSVNAYVIYQNKLYRCKANTTAGIVPTNTTYWEQVSISSLNQSLANKKVKWKDLYLNESPDLHGVFDVVLPENPREYALVLLLFTETSATNSKRFIYLWDCSHTPFKVVNYKNNSGTIQETTGYMQVWSTGNTFSVELNTLGLYLWKVQVLTI